MVVATALGDFPLARADWLVVETVVLVEEGELVGGRGPAALVIVASLPSGFVPYCTGWNNLIAEGRKTLSNVQTSQYLTRTCKIGFVWSFYCLPHGFDGARLGSWRRIAGRVDLFYELLSDL